MTSKSSSSGITGLSTARRERLHQRLSVLYGNQADQALDAIWSILQRHPATNASPGWSQRDVVLITYADQVQAEGQPTLAALQEFLVSHGLFELLNTVHLLPFFPFSSDDGFSVVDYRQVRADVGDWSHVQQLATHCHLMFDLVLNHCSRESVWFQEYLRGTAPYDRYFLEADPSDNLAQVTRPRSSPLLTPVETSRGRRHVWTTFSADQVDLNFRDPRVLSEFVDILLFYVRMGARIIRLDAIAYLWKEPGTNGIHLPKTHEVVKLLRDVLEAVAPHVLLLTETNVPHSENISYFGQGDEAHLVYQFSLPPLLLDAFLSHDATALVRWLDGLPPAAPGTTFFNFTASHDGIGVRPLEGLVSPQQFGRLVEAARQRGSLVGTKRNPDGSDVPYELNVTYVDALGDPSRLQPGHHARRFLSSQAVMLALPGVPGVYFHSLVGTRNDVEGAASSGVPRRINRRKFQLRELDEALSDPNALQAQIFQGYQRMLRARIAQPAFHPEAACRVLPQKDPAVLAFQRTSCDGKQRIVCVTNLHNEERTFAGSKRSYDLLSEQDLPAGEITLGPNQTRWMVQDDPS